MGPRGKEIQRIRDKYDVQIEMPGGKMNRAGGRFQSQRSQEPDEIIIKGTPLVYIERPRHYDRRSNRPNQWLDCTPLKEHAEPDVVGMV